MLKSCIAGNVCAEINVSRGQTRSKVYTNTSCFLEGQPYRMKDRSVEKTNMCFMMLMVSCNFYKPRTSGELMQFSCRSRRFDLLTPTSSVSVALLSLSQNLIALIHLITQARTIHITAILLCSPCVYPASSLFTLITHGISVAVRVFSETSFDMELRRLFYRLFCSSGRGLHVLFDRQPEANEHILHPACFPFIVRTTAARASQ